MYTLFWCKPVVLLYVNNTLCCLALCYSYFSKVFLLRWKFQHQVYDALCLFSWCVLHRSGIKHLDFLFLLFLHPVFPPHSYLYHYFHIFSEITNIWCLYYTVKLIICHFYYKAGGKEIKILTILLFEYKCQEVLSDFQ